MEIPSSSQRYTDLEKQELIEQWKSSGRSKLSFCREHRVGYYSFCHWIQGKKKKEVKTKNSFVSLKIKNSDESVFTQLILKNGTTVNIFKPVDASYLVTLLKA